MLKPTTLKNGLTVLRIPRASSKSTLIGYVTTSGSSMEEGYFPQGISHLVERLFWCGTDKHPSTRNLNLSLESMGGNFTSLTSHELTALYLTVPDYHQFKGVSLLSEIIQRSYFDARDIEKEKKSMIEYLKNHSENAEMEASFLSMSNLYANSSYGLPVYGSIDSVSNITQENVLEYLAHQYRPDKSCLVIAGSFENKALMELIDQEWGVWSPRTKKFIEPMDFQPEDVGQLPRLVYRQRGISQTQLTVNFLLDDGMRPKALLEQEKSEKPVEVDYKKVLEEYLKKQANILVLNTLLGQGLSSRLWTKTVEEEMLFNSIQSEIFKFKSTGFLQIFGRIENSQFSFGLESVLSVLEAFKKTTVSINELAKAREYLKGRLIMDQEDLVSAAFWQLEHLIGTGLVFEPEDLIAKIEKVEAPQIRTLANSLFVSEKMAITTLGPAKETRLVEKLIKKYLG
jgi:predicted Zn-dependent peptidase